MTDIGLPIPVTQYPHWRVLFRPQTYERERIARLADCLRIVARNQVRLRGWDFPHLSHHAEETETGANWVASWSSFMGHFEYWRFYQSTQFIYLGSIRERTERDWDQRLRTEAQSHFGYLGFDASNVPGFLSIKNSIYTVTEYFEFASRLCQAEVYEGALDISIGLHGVNGFVLTTDPDRFWHRVYQSTADDLEKVWTLSTTDLIASSHNKALEAIVWFFERFGWTQVSTEVLRRDQEDFLANRL